MVLLLFCAEFWINVEGGKWDQHRHQLSTVGAVCSWCLQAAQNRQWKENIEVLNLRKSKLSPEPKIKPLATPTQIYKAPGEWYEGPWESWWKGASALLRALSPGQGSAQLREPSNLCSLCPCSHTCWPVPSRGWTSSLEPKNGIVVLINLHNKMWYNFRCIFLTSMTSEPFCCCI